MKVTFYIDDKGSVRFPTASSDLACKKGDCFQLIAGEVIQGRVYKELVALAAAGDDFEWWGEYLRIFCSSGRVRVLHPGCEDDEYAEMSLLQLRMFLRDWKVFLEKGERFDANY